MLQSLNNSHIVRFCNLHLKQFPTFLEMALYTTSKINRWFLYMASKFHLCIYTCAWILCDRPTVSNCFCSILHLLISISLHFIAQLIIKCTHTRTCICACRPLMHAHIRTHKRTHTRARTHIHFPPSGGESGLLRLTAPHCPCAVVCQLCLPPSL